MDELFISLPHRFPFRMIDRIIEMIPKKRVIPIKNITGDEPYLQGHLLKAPCFPSILILEAMAQTAGMAFHSFSEPEGEALPFLVRIDKVRIKRSALPGDQLILEGEIEQIFSNFSKVKVRAQVQKELIARGIFFWQKSP